jgi:hypothetical protein
VNKGSTRVPPNRGMHLTPEDRRNKIKVGIFRAHEKRRQNILEPQRITPAEKVELDQAVAEFLELPLDGVAMVTDAFIGALSDAVVDRGGAYLPNVGTLLLKVETHGGGVSSDGTPDQLRTRIYFKKAAALKLRIAEQFGIPVTPDNKWKPR